MTDRIGDFLTKAATESVELHIRELLGVWGFRARTPDTTARIQRDLSGARLRCIPDLGVGDLDDLVRVTVPVQAPSPADSAGEAGSDSEEDQPLRLPHVLPEIGEIPSATNAVMAISPSDTIEDAQSVMVEHDFSQLAVMTGPYELTGAVSWRTIAQARLGDTVIKLDDPIELHPQAIDRHPVLVRTTDKLLDVIDAIYDADFVFVRNQGERVCGIVTTADLSAQFRDLTTPFFWLGEIEHRLRACIRAKGLTIDEIRQATGKNGIKSVDSMTFGNYYYLLQDVDVWRKMRSGFSQERFLPYLKYACDIRNKVAHYDARPVNPDEKQNLERCLRYVRWLSPDPGA